MDSDNNQKVIYCADDDEYRIWCNVCDKLCKERFHKNHFKSGTHISNIHKKRNFKTNMNYYWDIYDKTIKRKWKMNPLYLYHNYNMKNVFD